MRTVIGRFVILIGVVVNDRMLRVNVKSVDEGSAAATVVGPRLRECRRLEFDRRHKLGISASLAARLIRQASAVRKPVNKRIVFPVEADTGPVAACGTGWRGSRSNEFGRNGREACASRSDG